MLRSNIVYSQFTLWTVWVAFFVLITVGAVVAGGLLGFGWQIGMRLAVMLGW